MYKGFGSTPGETLRNQVFLDGLRVLMKDQWRAINIFWEWGVSGAIFQNGRPKMAIYMKN